MTRGRVPSAYGLLFFLCFFILLSSGRIASSDAGQQRQVAVMLALTGRMGDDGAPGGPVTPGWVHAPNGRWYQAHDIGNVALMLPAAWIGGHLSRASAAEQIVSPPAVSRVGASLASACLAALGCWWLFRLFTLDLQPATAFAASLAFPLTTTFMAYSRAAWDVLGACCFMCGVLYYSAALLRGIRPLRSAVLLAVALACACSFRYSLAPFIVPAAAAVLWLARRSPGAHAAASGVAFASLMLPTFAYNFVRTGSPLRPATASPVYLEGPNALTGDMLHGLYGLFASPNRGLFVFSPVLLTALALPLVWRRLTREQRVLIGAYGAGVAGYVLLVSKLVNWGAFGWGPRYLVPVLPVLFAAAVLAAANVSAKMRVAVFLLAACSVVLMLPTAVVNWHMATTDFAGAADSEARRPYQLVAGWRALVMGLQGEDLPVPAGSRGDSLRATTGVFPDLWLARLARQSSAFTVLALILFAAGVTLAAGAVRGILAST